MKKECPLCKKSTSDLLQHLSIKHGLRNIEDFEEKMEVLKGNKRKQREFSNYVEKLKKLIVDGKLSAEEYRELITKWSKENNW